MRLLIFFAIVGLTKARVIEDCSGVVVHNINHEREILKKHLNSPYQLAIDYDTNYLFFSYSTPEDEADGFKSAYINLKTNEFGIIQGINGGFANAVDEKKHIVYLGGNDGIYTFDYNTKKAKILDASNKSIWQLFFKDKLYYTDYPNEIARYFENGISKKVPELEGTKSMLLAIDRDNNIYYSNGTGLFSYKKDKSKFYSLGDYSVNGFAADVNKNIYFSSPYAIYIIDENQEVQKLAEINNLYGLAIEADNSIIYADRNSLVRLKPTKNKCFSNDDKKL